MVLLDPVVQVLVGPVLYTFGQLGPDRAWITVVTIRRDTRGRDPGDSFGRSKERLRRRHVALLAQPDVNKRTESVDSAIKIMPTPVDLDVSLVNLPTPSNPAFAPPPEIVDQGRAELRLPIAHGFVTERDPSD